MATCSTKERTVWNYDPALNDGRPNPLSALLMNGQVFMERTVGMAQPTIEPQIIERDGILIDMATGEIVGVYEPEADYPKLMIDVRPEERFCVNTMGRLEWVMERFQNRELAAQTLTRRRELLVKNLDAMIADENRDLERLHARFDAEIHAFAKEQLEGGKTKTLKTAFGRVSFAISRAANKITDMALAVEWARGHAPGIIKTVESVGVTELLGAWEVDHLEDPEEIPAQPAFVDTRPPEERMHIRTGATQEEG